MECTLPYVISKKNNKVVTLTLNRGDKFNPLSEDMMDAFKVELEKIALDKDLRAVVLSADGNAFCAGHDLKEMRSEPKENYYKKLFKQCSSMMLLMQKLPQPIIARVHGIATAAGCQLVSMCDLAVASKEAKFAVSGVNYGLFCSTPSVGLSRNIARKNAMEMLLTGDFIDADTAKDWGLINRVVEQKKLDDEVQKLLNSILKKPAVAISMGKQLFYQQIEMGINSAYELASETMAKNMMKDETLEGIQAFIEKRSPKW
tara:strand:- start:270 stop:1046 length:777 start_codon:yes stop_codon:yes gene_type:complete